MDGLKMNFLTITLLIDFTKAPAADQAAAGRVVAVKDRLILNQV